MLAFLAAMALSSPGGGAGNFSSISDSFVANKGQWDSRARYMARSHGANLWVTDDGYVIDFSRTVGDRKVGNVVSVRLEGAKAAQAEGLKELPGKVNYLLGKTEVSGASRFSEVKTVNTVSGVDARYYFEDGRPRYDLVLRPGADVSAIRLSYDGAQNLRVGKDGKLRYDTSLGTVEERGLYAYQNVNGRQVQVSASVKVGSDGKVGFELGAYDKSKSVVIDPIVWATYAGGSGADSARKVILDKTGNVIVLGNTESADFPVTTGAYDTSANGGSDVSIARYSSDGTTLQFATYYGGSGNETVSGLALNGLGNIIFAGSTTSTNLPTKGGQFVAGARGGNDGYLAVLESTGASLRTSSYLGGSGNDNVANVATDENNVFVVGTTNSTNFPVVGGSTGERTGIQRNKLAGTDAFFCKVNIASGNLIFSTYLGSSGDDTGVDVQPLGGGKAAVLGNTTGTNLLNAWASKPGFQKNSGGGSDAFLVGVSADGLTVDFRTYLGGSGADTGSALAGDATAGFLVVGNTASSNFPVLGGLNAPYRGPSAFLTKVVPAGTSYEYSFYYTPTQANAGSVFASDVAFDSNGSPVMVGTTDSPNLPVAGNGAVRTRPGGIDAYVARFSATGNRVFYGSYLGGTGDETNPSLAVGADGLVYLVNTTTSTDFPVTPGTVQQTRTGDTDGTVTEFSLPVTVMSFTVGGIVNPYRTIFQIVLDGTTYRDLQGTLSSSTNLLEVPSSFTILKNSRSTSFSANVKPLLQDTPFEVTATVQGETFVASGTLLAPNITAISLDSSSIQSGESVSGALQVTPTDTVTPVILRLVDGAGNAVPDSVATVTSPTLGRNASVAAFTITSTASQTASTVYVEGPKGVRSGPLTLKAAQISTFTLSRSAVRGPFTMSGSVRLNGFAPVGGYVVHLTSSDSSVTVPESITIPYKKGKLGFSIDVAHVTTDRVVTVTATAQGFSLSAQVRNVK